MTEADFAWLAALLIVILAVANRLLFRSWAAPSAFFALFWSLMTLAPLTLAPHYPVWGAGVLVIASFVIAMTIGALLGNKVYVIYLYKPKWHVPAELIKMQLSPTILRIQKAGWIGAILGMVGILLAVKTGFNTIDMKFSIENLFKAASALSYARYREDMSMPISARIANVVIFFACFAAGMVLRLGATGWAKVVLPTAALSGTLIYAFTFTNKAPFFMSVLIIGGSYLASSVMIEGERMKIFTRVRLVFSSLVLVFGIAMLIISQMLRYGLEQLESDSVVFERAQSYALSHLAAFTGWIEKGYSFTDAPAMGIYSFSGQLGMLGLTDRIPGLYEATGLHADVVGTNLFTVFRGLMQDFTYPGALVILVVSGVAAQICYLCVARGQAQFRVFAFVILVAFYTWTAYSFVVNIFMYNSIFLALILFGILLFFSQKKFNTILFFEVRACP